MKNQIHKLVRLAVCAVAVLTANASKAATVYSSAVTVGNWNGGSTWNVTGSGNPVTYVINTGHIITMNVNVSGVDSVLIYGVLNLNSNRTLTIDSFGSIVVQFGGSLQGGSNNTHINFLGSSYQISGPFTSLLGNLISDGPRYANAFTTNAAAGDPQGSFVGLSLLPVQLSSINVEKVGNAHQLSFTALGESNQHTFTVEVSKDGRTFEFAGTLNGNRELVEGEYEFNIYGMNNSFYVRLSETDANGTITVLATKYVKNIATSVDAFQLYPTLITPAGQSINMVLPVSGTHKVVVYTMDMQIAAESTATTYSDNEVATFNSSNWNLNAGYYVVVVSGSNGEIHKTRIMVR